MTFFILVVAEIFQVLPAKKMIDKQEDHTEQLGMHPSGSGVVRRVVGIDNSAEEDGHHRGWRHDAPIQFSLHNLEAFATGVILTHGVVYE